MHGWGHWAMPAHKDLVFQELQNGEFIELNDLIAPLDELLPLSFSLY